MARGQFLQGLSEGIFGRLGELRQEQTSRDDNAKLQTIQMLAGLADKIEPEGLPMLMGHIWDTMGIKKKATGKGLRGFLDAFSGVPNRSVEDQIGTKFKELTDSFVGPQTAKDVRLRGNISQKGIPGLVQAAPQSAYGQKAAMDVQDLGKKMVFRDPYQQKISEIEARYGSQLENQLFMQNQRNDAALTKQADLYNRRDQEKKADYDRKINLMIDKVAIPMMMDEDILQYHPSQRKAAARQKAMAFLSDENVSKAEYLDAGTQLRKDAGAKLRSETTPQGKAITPYQDAQLKEKIIADAQEIIGKLGPSAKSALELEQSYAPLRKQMEDIAAKRGLTYSPEAGVFLGDPTKVAVAEAFAGDTLKLARDARSKFTEAEGKASAEHLKLKDKRFEGYLNIGESWRDPVSVAEQRARKATPPPKAQKPGAKTSSFKFNQDAPIYKIPTDSSEAKTWIQGQTVKPSYLKGEWEVGEEVEENGRKFKVIRRKQ